MTDLEKVIKELDRMTEDARAMDLEWAIGIDDFATLCKALELLKEYAVVKESISDEIHETAKMFRRTAGDNEIPLKW